MTSVLVTGSSRGIGLELVKRLAAHVNHPDFVIATCRDPVKAQELSSLSQRFTFVKVLKLDVDKVENYPEFVSQVREIVGENGLNILINNAGVSGDKTTEFEQINYENYVNIFKTNLLGPVFLTQALLPLLKGSAALKKDSATGFNQVAVVNVSSVLGSVSVPGQVYWGYNESKAALNRVTRSMASNLKKDGILALCVHPGWVRTDMGGPSATLSVEESVCGLMNLICNLSPAMNDKFLRYDGSEIEW